MQKMHLLHKHQKKTTDVWWCTFFSHFSMRSRTEEGVVLINAFCVFKHVSFFHLQQ